MIEFKKKIDYISAAATTHPAVSHMALSNLNYITRETEKSRLLLYVKQMYNNKWAEVVLYSLLTIHWNLSQIYFFCWFVSTWEIFFIHLNNENAKFGF